MCALLDFVEDRRSSALLDQGIRRPEVADNVRAALGHLDDFLDVPADCLPTDTTENMRVGHRLQPGLDP